MTDMPLGTGPGAGADWRRVETWIFDVDNTLYPAECRLFAQIDARMSAFVQRLTGLDAAAARRLQKDLYVRYGTTLAGLMAEYRAEPAAFLDYVHDIDLDAVTPDPGLAAALGRLPGRRYLFTNGSHAHAARVAARLGVLELFDDVFDVAAADFVPKPHRAAYDRFLARHGVAGPRAAMFEDIAVNLEAPHALGMTTVLVRSAAPWIADEPAEKRPAVAGTPPPPHVHHATDDLPRFLAEVADAAAA